MKHDFFFLLFIFISGTVIAQDAVPAADVVMKKAFEQATKENKKVFLIFHASWCGWCHKMDTAMNDPSIKSFFKDHYVITHLTVLESNNKKALENKGANAMLQQYAGENSGIPFWVIFDKDGNLLADAQRRPAGARLSTRGENTGCPATQEEVAHFIQVLKNTSSLKEAQLNLIAKRFRENEQ